MTNLAKSEMYVVNQAFKYAGKLLEIGKEFIPDGGKWDHILTNPEKKYVRIEERKPKKKVEITEYKCDYCDRTFTTPQGKAAHMRFCKQKE